MPLVPQQTTHDKDQVLTKASFETPWYFRIANLVIPGVVIAPGVFALLAMLGAPAVMPLSAVILLTISALAFIALVAPKISNIFKWFMNMQDDPDPLDTNKLEYKPHPYRFSNARAFDWTLRFTIAVSAFALLAVIIAFFVVNPAGAIVGTSVMQLIEFSAAPLSIAAAAGAAFGIFVAFAWKPLAKNFFLFSAKTKAAGDTTIDPQELKAPSKELERRFYGSKHDIPAYVRLAFGLLAGAAIASFVSLAMASTGGLSAIPFAIITVSMGGIAAAYAPISNAIGNYFQGPRKLVSAEFTQKRYWFERSTLDLHFYMYLFLGVAAGITIGSVFGGTALIIAPAVCGGLALIMPAIFSLLKYPFKRGEETEAKSAIDRLKAEDGFFGPTPHGHKTGDLPWAARLFNGATAGAILAGATLALGGAPVIAIALGISLPLLAAATPVIFAALRTILPKDRQAINPMTNRLLFNQDHTPKVKPHWFTKWFVSPEIDTQHKVRGANSKAEKSADGQKALVRNKFLIAGQAYVRAAVGAIVGTLVAASLGFIANPIVAPWAIIATTLFFVFVPPILKRLEKLYYRAQQPVKAVDYVDAMNTAGLNLITPSVSAAHPEQKTTTLSWLCCLLWGQSQKPVPQAATKPPGRR